jgi:8-oxo-dGTP diphosphatase
MSPAFDAPLPHINITVDVAIFTVHDNQLQIVLIKRTNEPYKGEWALPGGYLQEGERSADSAARVLDTKAGVKDVYLEQLFTFDDLDRDARGRVISVSYFALVPTAKLAFSGSDVQHPTLFPIDSLPKLAFDHTTIVRYAVQRLQAKLEYTNAVMSLLPKTFTLSELQSAYEAILARPLDKRNFQKKFLSLDIITATDTMRAGGKHRPARLYRFNSEHPAELKKFF